MPLHGVGSHHDSAVKTQADPGGKYTSNSHGQRLERFLQRGDHSHTNLVQMVALIRCCPQLTKADIVEPNEYKPSFDANAQLVQRGVYPVLAGAKDKDDRIEQERPTSVITNFADARCMKSCIAKSIPPTPTFKD